MLTYEEVRDLVRQPLSDAGFTAGDAITNASSTCKGVRSFDLQILAMSRPGSFEKRQGELPYFIWVQYQNRNGTTEITATVFFRKEEGGTDIIEIKMQAETPETAKAA